MALQPPFREREQILTFPTQIFPAVLGSWTRPPCLSLVQKESLSWQLWYRLRTAQKVCVAISFGTKSNCNIFHFLFFTFFDSSWSI